MYGCSMLPLSFLAVSRPFTRSRALVMRANGYWRCVWHSSKGLSFRTCCAVSDLQPPYLLQTIQLRRISGGSPSIGTLEDPTSARTHQTRALEVCTSGTEQRQPGYVKGLPPLNKAGSWVAGIVFRESSWIQPRSVIAPTLGGTAQSKNPFIFYFEKKRV